MRVALLVIIHFVSLTAVGQANLPAEWSKRFSEFNQNGKYRVSASIKPVFLESDLSGDSKKTLPYSWKEFPIKRKAFWFCFRETKNIF